MLEADEVESACDSPVSSQDFGSEEKPSLKRSIELEDIFAKKPKSELMVDTTFRGMTPPAECPETETNLLPTPAESEPESQENCVHTPNPYTPDLSVAGSPVSESGTQCRQKQRRKSDFAVPEMNDVNVSSHIQYIVSSLDRHTDSAVLLKKNGNAPISPFKKIMQKASNLEYILLEDLEKDVDRMLNTLTKQGQVVDRVRKHYDYLVSYYFPSRVIHGKRRSVRSS
jgi:hypothetical protein